LHGLALWIWHLPVLYEATFRSDLVHTLQHSSFFGSTVLPTPLEDQQLGGLLMWVPAGVLYVISALFLFTAWMHGPAPAGRTGKRPWQSTAGAS
jgi:putative membrane protein